jgi:anti-anti-sigma factor
MRLHGSSTWFDQLVVVAARGDVDALTAPRLNDEILRVLAEQPSAVIVDLTAVDFLASSGMTVLISAHEKIAPTAHFGVVASGSGTSRPLKLMAIDSVISLYETLPEAIAACTTA